MPTAVAGCVAAGGLSHPLGGPAPRVPGRAKNSLPGSVMTRMPRGDTPLRRTKGTGSFDLPSSTRSLSAGQPGHDGLVGRAHRLAHLVVRDGPADPQRVPPVPTDVAHHGRVV